MLPKKNRINVELFETIGKSGKRVSSPLFSFVYSFENTTDPRFAVVIGKKRLSLAIGRNRIRRRIYSIIENHLSDLKSISGIFYLQPQSLKASNEELEEEILTIFKKVGIIENKVDSY
jgi:ribonuclease P protein component